MTNSITTKHCAKQNRTIPSFTVAVGKGTRKSEYKGLDYGYALRMTVRPSPSRFAGRQRYHAGFTADFHTAAPWNKEDGFLLSSARLRA